MAVGQHNLARLGEESFARLGDHDSLLFEGAWYRSGELYERARCMAGGLIEMGIAPGDRVVVFMANSPDVGVAYWALWRSGAAITPAIFLLPPEELRHVVGDAGARAVVTSPEFIGIVREAVAGLPDLEWIICSGPEQEGAISISSLENAEPAEIIDRADSDLAALLYTGGTTGRAKGVMLSHENLWFSSKSLHDHGNREDTDRVLVPLPLSHAYGLLISVLGMHAERPGIAALQRWFDPSEFLTLIQEHKLQIATVVPSMIQILLSQPLEEYDLSSLQYLGCGAAPLPREVAEEFLKRVPWVQIREGYGCTESGAVMSANKPQESKIGSVGTPIGGYELRILDDDGNGVPTGQPGEICCRSKGVMMGYWNAPEATAATIRDGWLYTGDIGYLDEDGYLYVVDRKKDLIIRGGFNVFPRDVEDVLLEHPAVAMAGVVGRPDTAKGEEVVAFVSLKPGAETTEGELIAFAKSKLSAYKYPREVHIIPAVPLTPVMKVDRKVLRGMLPK
ncbi:MAG: long-chain fatty acid--CoA ligase [Actinobacteria bacterium]|nr:MAG: long-chain fatty acid--CoA ligase [Actinomycetota bacterium]